MENINIVLSTSKAYRKSLIKHGRSTPIIEEDRLSDTELELYPKSIWVILGTIGTWILCGLLMIL